MPLFISSECVSAHTPDKRSSKVVFPWSTWPTMPILSSGCITFSFDSSAAGFLARGIFLLFLLFHFLGLRLCILLVFMLWHLAFFLILFCLSFLLILCFRFFFAEHVSKLFC